MRFRVPISLSQYRKRKRSQQSHCWDDCETECQWIEIGPESLEQTWSRTRQQSLADLQHVQARRIVRRKGGCISSSNEMKPMAMTLDFNENRIGGGLQTARDVCSGQESVTFILPKDRHAGPMTMDSGNGLENNGSQVLLHEAGQKTKKMTKSQNQSRRNRRHQKSASSKRRQQSKREEQENLYEPVKSDAKNDELDVIRNVHKLGIETKPIPFSYKSGQDGREKERVKRNIWDDLCPNEPEGLYMYTLFARKDESSMMNAEENSTRLLETLHKRLGYKKQKCLEKITNNYELNKRKYEAAVEAASERMLMLEDE